MAEFVNFISDPLLEDLLHRIRELNGQVEELTSERDRLLEEIEDLKDEIRHADEWRQEEREYRDMVARQSRYW